MVERLREEKGAVMILFALLIVFLIALIGVTADAGLIFHHRSLLQNAADAAALAGAYQLPDISNAAAEARQYGSHNGVMPNDTFVVSFPAFDRIRVAVSRNVRLNFASLVGYNNIPVGVKATAQVVRGGLAFDYALFSGSPKDPLEINGGTEIINGSVHSNFDTIVKGSDLTITNRLDMVGTFTGTGNKINIGTIVEHYRFMDMPDFSDLIESAAGQVYNSDVTFSGNTNVAGNIYANGSVTFNGGKIQGVGTVLSAGGITVNGDLSYNSDGDAVCLYSKNGDITINGGQYGTVVHGIFYAPNGTVTFNGAKVTIIGAVIAKTIVWNGVKVSISYDGHAVYSIPNTSVQLVE